MDGSLERWLDRAIWHPVATRPNNACMETGTIFMCLMGRGHFDEWCDRDEPLNLELTGYWWRTRQKKSRQAANQVERDDAAPLFGANRSRGKTAVWRAVSKYFSVAQSRAHGRIASHKHQIWILPTSAPSMGQMAGYLVWPGTQIREVAGKSPLYIPQGPSYSYNAPAPQVLSPTCPPWDDNDGGRCCFFGARVGYNSLVDFLFIFIRDTCSPGAAFNHVRVRHRPPHTLPRAPPQAQVRDPVHRRVTRDSQHSRARTAANAGAGEWPFADLSFAESYGGGCGLELGGRDASTTGAEVDDVAWLGGFRAGLREVVLSPDSLNERTGDQTTPNFIQVRRRLWLQHFLVIACRHEEALFSRPLKMLRDHVGPFAIQTCFINARERRQHGGRPSGRIRNNSSEPAGAEQSEPAPALKKSGVGLGDPISIPCAASRVASVPTAPAALYKLCR
ncbi:hypothetical protein GGX14DRAFT_406241 [Mycena pura]|uniref:Uncharacterized protein n=1 Tax=Mycena pura TaxID=153505 RepID=A0AAD6XZT2_9AGAR|nr:hypothetical protein GGX14DRAFT_406241 [Mycena pura]